jgi:hypothetical protein
MKYIRIADSVVAINRPRHNDATKHIGFESETDTKSIAKAMIHGILRTVPIISA